jgi:hypothetical protein
MALSGPPERSISDDGAVAEIRHEIRAVAKQAWWLPRHVGCGIYVVMFPLLIAGFAYIPGAKRGPWSALVFFGWYLLVMAVARAVIARVAAPRFFRKTIPVLEEHAASLSAVQLRALVESLRGEGTSTRVFVEPMLRRLGMQTSELTPGTAPEDGDEVTPSPQHGP